MSTTGHESEAINVQGLKASLQKLKANHIDGKAGKSTTLAGYGITDAYTKSETYTKTEVNGLVDTPHQEYVTVDAYASLPTTGNKDTIYRVSNYNGSTSQVDASVYSEYAWDGTQYIFLCVKSQIGEVFDISVYNNNAKYADLAAALNGGANIPQSLQKGGMSVKFVQSSDNNYIQYRYMSDDATTVATFTNVNNWEGGESIAHGIAELGFIPTTPLTPSATAESWKLTGDGLSAPDSSYKMEKYSVIAGDILKINVSKDSNGVMQFQSAANVPGSGTNGNLVGYPYTNAVNELVKVPVGATYLIVSQLKTNTTNLVEKKVCVDDEPIAGSDNLVKSEGVYKRINELQAKIGDTVKLDLKYPSGGYQGFFGAFYFVRGKKYIVTQNGTNFSSLYLTTEVSENEGRVQQIQWDVEFVCEYDNIVGVNGYLEGAADGDVFVECLGLKQDIDEIGNVVGEIGNVVAEVCGTEDNIIGEHSATFNFTNPPYSRYANRAIPYKFKNGTQYRISVLTENNEVKTYLSIRRDEEGSQYPVVVQNNLLYGKGARTGILECTGDADYLYMSVDEDTSLSISYNVLIQDLSNPIAEIKSNVYEHGKRIDTIEDEVDRMYSPVTKIPLIENKSGAYSKLEIKYSSGGYQGFFGAFDFVRGKKYIVTQSRTNFSSLYLTTEVSENGGRVQQIQWGVEFVCEYDNVVGVNGWLDGAADWDVFVDEKGILDEQIESLSYTSDIISLNPHREFDNRLRQMRWPYVNDGTEGNPVLMLAWFSDIHNCKTQLSRIVKWCDSFKSFLDDIIHTGDNIMTWTDSFGWWGEVDGAEKILNIMGNHDNWDMANNVSKPSTDYYPKFFAPYIANWNVVQPQDAATYGYSYWYKDYTTNKIRLIALDCMNSNSDQQTWLASVLADAKTTGLSVVIANHSAPAGISTKTDCSFTTQHLKDTNVSVYSAWALPIVQSFIDSGGKFICWIGGHVHRDIVGTLDNYPEQACFLVDTSRVDNYWTDHKTVNNTKSADLFNIIGFDTTRKVVSLLRVGNDCDNYMRHIGQMCYDYENKRVLSSW